MKMPEQGTAHWKRCVEAARVLLINGSQREAAKAAGVRREAVNRWTKQPWWRDVEQSTRSVENLEDFAAECLAIVRKAVKDGDANLAFKCLERLHNAFVPLERREHTQKNALGVVLGDWSSKTPEELAAMLDEVDDEKLLAMARGAA